jgi:hypothetical protein
MSYYVRVMHTMARPSCTFVLQCAPSSPPLYKLARCSMEPPPVQSPTCLPRQPRLLTLPPTRPPACSSLQRCRGPSPRSAVSEGHLSLLLNQGFLTRHTLGADGYLFAMPGAGPAVKSVREGRAEIVQASGRGAGAEQGMSAHWGDVLQGCVCVDGLCRSGRSGRALCGRVSQGPGPAAHRKHGWGLPSRRGLAFSPLHSCSACSPCFQHGKVPCLHSWVCTAPSPQVLPLKPTGAPSAQALQRRRYAEIPERELEKRRLQRSVLGVRFHVRDMLGSGALLRLDTTVGPVLRLAQKKP